MLPWVTAAVILFSDRLSKLWIMKNVPLGASEEIMPGLSLSHVHNPGIAFSLFADGGPLSRLLLRAVILTSVMLIAWMMVRHGKGRRVVAFSFGLILGGAFGNLLDRVLYGWVVDFIHVWVRAGNKIWAWPDFNVADSAICVGAVFLVISELRNPAQTSGTKADASGSD